MKKIGLFHKISPTIFIHCRYLVSFSPLLSFAYMKLHFLMGNEISLLRERELLFEIYIYTHKRNIIGISVTLM